MGTCAYKAVTAGLGPAHLWSLVCPLLTEDLCGHMWTAERARPTQMGVSLWVGVGVGDLMGLVCWYLPSSCVNVNCSPGLDSPPSIPRGHHSHQEGPEDSCLSLDLHSPASFSQGPSQTGRLACGEQQAPSNPEIRTNCVSLTSHYFIRTRKELGRGNTGQE